MRKTHEIELTEKYKKILKEKITSHNSFRTTQVFKAMIIHEDMDLLNDFIKINWFDFKEHNNEHELFIDHYYGYYLQKII